MPAGEGMRRTDDLQGAGDRRADSRRILVIDDQRDVRLVLKAMLTKLGHSVSTAEDGLSGVQCATDEVPDIVFCDILMSGEMDGYDVARQLRASPVTAACHLIALTGRDTEEDRDMAFEVGFDSHAVKPVDFDKLQELLRRAAPLGET
jgi:two-component system, chemotaxis family, CheB/CheR fusion protein